MSEQDDADNEGLFAPLLSCQHILTTVLRRAGEESIQQQTALFGEWIHEVSSLAELSRWKADFRQKLQNGANLWLPGDDAQELGVLLGIADLANELGCSAIQLARAITELPLKGLKPSSLVESNGDSDARGGQVEARNAPSVEEDQEKQARVALAAEHKNAVDYQPLIEALNDWQAMFELALDQAATFLDHERFPARDLSVSLSEMCELLRDVLTKNSGVGETA